MTVRPSSRGKSMAEMKHRIACLGDLMAECIKPVNAFPEANTTTIFDAAATEIGGPAFNIHWYLSQLGHRTRIVSCYGNQDRRWVLQKFRDMNVNRRGLVSFQGQTDILLSVTAQSTHRSFYRITPITKDVIRKLKRKLGIADVIVLTGSRQKRMREWYDDLIQESGPVVFFNPSYAVYEYEDDSLVRIIQRSDVVFLNEQEDDHVCKVLGCTNHKDLNKVIGVNFVISMGKHGAAFVSKDSYFKEKGQPKRIRNTIGAGDALVSGFIHTVLDGGAYEEALKYGLALSYKKIESEDVRIRIV